MKTRQQVADPVQIPPAEIQQCLDAESLRAWVEHQRWYASKSRTVAGIEIVEGVALGGDPTLFLALVQARFATGTHELYQLPLWLRHSDTDTEAEAIAHAGDWAVYDALAAPEGLVELLRRIDVDEEIVGTHGHFRFRRVPEATAAGEAAGARAMGVEQSNSSVVFDERLVLKVLRKLEPGVNPEIELLRFLTLRGFSHIAPLYGWYEYDGQPLAATLGIAQEFVPAAMGGWELGLREVRSDPEAFLSKLASLGAVTAQMHTVLASDAGDPAFSPEEPSQEALALLTATVDEDIERIFLRLPDDEGVAPIRGRGQDVRERLAARALAGAGGRAIRIHGDYHLGQTLYAPQGWVVLDFEGEPARSLPERRQKRSPLRDVAGMLRSFAYLASASSILEGSPPPADFERRARTLFLEQYLAHVEPSLLPPGEAQIANLLSIFELEKAIYELRYELDNRPDWVPVPVAGIQRLVEGE